jgi:uncharacterized repeat protein (TIGR01451 family)
MRSLIHKGMFACMLFLVAPSAAQAQLPMTRSTFSGTFSPITVGTGAVTSAASGDEQFQDGVPIGFTFNYLGSNYTSLAVSTNGWVRLATTVSAGNANSDLYLTTGALTIAPWWDDLVSNSILYQTQGTAPDRVFIVQWNTLSYFTGATQGIQFQVRMYESSNMIEFYYGNLIAGTANSSESASIGIAGNIGGAGNYLDATTGSALVGNYFLSAANKWPARALRFTPGVPTALAGGTYTVGLAGDFSSLSGALAQLNHRGIAGPVVLSLIDADYGEVPANGDNTFPLVIAPIAGASAANTLTIQAASGNARLLYDGQASGGIANAASLAAASVSSEPILALVGARYVTLRHVDMISATTGVVDRGLAVFNQSATSGAQFNVFQDIGVQLNRGNASSIAIEQRVITPSAASGANSNNQYLDLSIRNTYAGINVVGNGTFPDLNTLIGTSSPTTFNSIGAPIALDLGNGATASYGISIANNSSFNVFNNEIRNVSVNAVATADGIVMTGVQGLSSVYRNKIHHIQNTSTSATSNVTGIRGNVTSTGANNLRIYNNFLSAISSNYAGAPIATRQIKGIHVQTGGGGAATTSIEIDHNNVAIDASSSPNVASACFEIGSNTGPIINVRNNVFANFTAAQSAPASHYAWVSTSATSVGNTGSVSNFNDLFVANATQGFVGRGNTTDYASLANWQTAMVGQDANSVSGNPGFTNILDDLHVTATELNAAGSSIPWVTMDIDNATRGLPPDVGADEFDLILDGTPPNIAYTALGDVNVAGNRSLIATITDLSGVPTSGPGLPVLYWRINASPYIAAVAMSLSANAYQFSFGAGTLPGDIVAYYVAAQDSAPAANVTSHPSLGASGYTSSPPAVSTPPTTPSSYRHIASEIVVSGNSQIIVDGDTTPNGADDTDFGGINISGGSILRTFTIANQGTDNLTLGNVNVSGAQAADFVVSLQPSASIAPNTNTTFQITFAPSAAGLRSANLSFSNNDADENPFEFSVQGTGIVADLQISKSNFSSGLLPGRATLYTIQVVNAGPGAVSSVTIVDTLPSALSDASWVCSSIPSALCPAPSGNGNINHTTGPLPSDALLEYNLIATPTGAPPAFISNTASVSNNDGNDPDVSNNTATDTDPIVPEGIFIDGFENTGMVLLRLPAER